jgi:DNA-binding transcriptional ArsR family regulator
MANTQILLHILADPTRRTLIEALRTGPLTVGALAQRTPVTRSAVSQHLRVLKDAELVTERQDGTRRYYSLQAERLGELRAYVDSLWTDALDQFSKHNPQESQDEPINIQNPGG